jgi:hypothetical protein
VLSLFVATRGSTHPVYSIEHGQQTRSQESKLIALRIENNKCVIQETIKAFADRKQIETTV